MSEFDAGNFIKVLLFRYELPDMLGATYIVLQRCRVFPLSSLQFAAVESADRSQRESVFLSSPTSKITIPKVKK